MILREIQMQLPKYRFYNSAENSVYSFTQMNKDQKGEVVICDSNGTEIERMLYHIFGDDNNPTIDIANKRYRIEMNSRFLSGHEIILSMSFTNGQDQDIFLQVQLEPVARI